MANIIPLPVREIVRAEADCKHLLFVSLEKNIHSQRIPIEAIIELCTELSVPLPSKAPLPSEPGNDDKLRHGSCNKKNVSCNDALLYDVLRIHKGRIILLQSHLERIAQNIEATTSRPLSPDALLSIEAAFREYVAMQQEEDHSQQDKSAFNMRGDQNMKFITWVSHAINLTDLPLEPENTADDLQFVVFFIKSFFPPPEWYVHGTRLACLYDARREMPNVKLTQNEMRARAKRLQDSANVFEVLLVHNEKNGYLVPEGSRSNYLLITESGKLLSSAMEDILQGITLQATERAATHAGLGEIEHRKLTLHDVCYAQSLVIMGTSVGVLPVRQIVLYQNATEESQFYVAASYCIVNTNDLKGFEVLSNNPPIAVLNYAVGNDVVTRLMQAYKKEASLE